MQKLRITSGIYRGRMINAPASGFTHPTGAREKLALFNMIGGQIEGARVLDAYAGSGALGIEALSRGAVAATFVEKSPEVASVIRANLQELGLSGEVIISTATTYCDRATTTGVSYDMVLADPPYDNYDPQEVARLGALVNPGGVMVVSHPGETAELTKLLATTGLSLKKARKYAAAHITVYAKV